MKKTLLTGISVALSFVGFSQSNGVNRCGTDQKMQELRAIDPVAFDIHMVEQEQLLQNWIANNYEDFTAQRSIITIPVVVHIWEDETTVPDVAVYEQIVSLNEDYRNVNDDTTSIPAVFDSLRADIEVEFCLASTDPNGNPTNGIVRETPGGQPNGNDEMWDYQSYLNIYVYQINGGVLGFTQLASGNPNYAVHIGTGYFGQTGASYPFNLGRTATHEVGHWLNLYHIWGDSNCGNDQVADTPPAQTSNFGCPSHPLNQGVCSGNTDGEMFMNYMDYTDDRCMNMLSKGQKARMIAAINTYRPGLLSSNGCSGSRVDADFTPSAAYILQGSSLNFNDASTGIGSGWNYNWVFNGGTPSTSTDQNPTGITYNTPGKYTAVLYIDSAEKKDIQVYAHTIIVHDGTSGIEDGNLSLENFKIYPNPSNGIFTINTNEENASIIVNDITGKQVFSTNINKENTIDIDLSGLPNGSYLVKLTSDNSSTVKKIQILK